VVFSNEVYSTFTAMSSRTLLSYHVVVPCILILSKSFYFTNEFTVYLFSSTIKIYIKIYTKIDPECFGLTKTKNLIIFNSIH